MKLTEYQPTSQLRPFIKAYRIIESDDEIINRVVPGTSFALAFRFKGQIAYLDKNNKQTLPSATFSGLRKTVRLINYAPKTAALIVMFTETGASAFFKLPIFKLFEESVSLDNFFRQSEISSISDQLAETEKFEDMITLIEKFLSSKLLYYKPDNLVIEAVNRIHATGGSMRINKLTNDLCISQDAFEKRFRKVVGSSAKQFSGIVRMNEIISKTPSLESLSTIALDHGFYDQPHFNKEFKLFTGLTPTAFFGAASYW
ncbi:helix-turn-helix domain-containing protein [Fulvivirga ulvae]|uniref:helix-turn-helix domain-containing protein n=1 Tax=Fulvivirga ulvae TaxID=2904245 RepID=UPI001F33A617|nr:helix-turn-helix domain-containing protein [Fulvivirga ulvae]UII32318.1 helix-turn-helix domain-containing protein [Fulvivirga ulvae]